MGDDKNLGLYAKYRVERVDGSSKHADCRYFVLDLDHDLHARNALCSYVMSCAEEYPALSADLWSLLQEIEGGE